MSPICVLYQGGRGCFLCCKNRHRVKCRDALCSCLNLLFSHLPSFLIVFSLPSSLRPSLPSSHLGAQHYLDTLSDRCSMSPSGLWVSRCFDINMSVFQRKITKLWVQKTPKDTTCKNYTASVQQIVMFS